MDDLGLAWEDFIWLVLVAGAAAVVIGDVIWRWPSEPDDKR